MSSTVYTNATNVTIAFWATSSSPLAYGTGTVHWGNSTSYNFTAPAKHFGTMPSGVAYLFLNYLEPNRTYYYKIVATGSCSDTLGTHQYSGTYSSQWTTAADRTDYIEGLVEDINGTEAPTGLTVQIGCHDPYTGYTYTATTPVDYSYGAGLNYKIAASSYCQAAGGPDGLGYTVTVLNGLMGNPNWQGRWNETVVVWQSQVVDFYVQTTTQALIPLDLGFNHADDSYINLTATSSTTTTITAIIPPLLNPLLNLNAQSTIVDSSSVTTHSGENNNYEYFGSYDAAGMVITDALTNRTPYVGWWLAWGPPLSQVPLPNKISDPKTIADYTTNSGCAAYEVGISPGTPFNGTVKVAGSTTYVNGLIMTISVGIGLSTGLGVSVGPSISQTVQGTVSVTTGYSFAWTWWMYNPYSTLQYGTVCADGSSTPGQGMVLHVWETSS